MHSFSKKNAEQGFVTTWLALVLPLLLAVVVVVGAGFIVLRADAEAKHLCRVGLLDTQEKVATSLTELLALNPQAQALRARREAAEAAIRSGVPQAVATGSAALAEVTAEQVALAALQKKLIVGAQLEGTKAPIQVRGVVRSALGAAQTRIAPMSDSPENSDAGRTLGNFFNGHIAATLPFFDVRSTPAGDLTPDYQPAEKFTQEQTILLSWTLAAGSILPAWAKPFLGTGQANLNLTGSCSASIEKENDKWIAKLQADKSSSN